MFDTWCDKVCQWLATGLWFSPGTPVSSTNKTDLQDIIEILLKVVLNTISQPYSSRIYIIQVPWRVYSDPWSFERFHEGSILIHGVLRGSMKGLFWSMELWEVPWRVYSDWWSFEGFHEAVYSDPRSFEGFHEGSFLIQGVLRGSMKVLFWSKEFWGVNVWPEMHLHSQNHKTTLIVTSTIKKKMEEYVHRTWRPQFTSKVNGGITLERRK